MYCNDCGKHNPAGSKFCESCGAKIIKVSASDRNVNDQVKINPTKPEGKDKIQNIKGVKSGLYGWLALIGFGLIVRLLMQGSDLLGYFPLFNMTYDIPGYMSLLQFEFVMSLASILVSVYLLYLYFKKNTRFPKYYIIFLIATAIYVTIDHIYLASLVVPTPEQQKIITDILAKSSSDVSRTIFFAIIWVWYMKKSKQVKATFINT